VKELTVFNSLLVGWFVLAAVVFMSLFFVAAPYGRHIRQGWGHTIGNKLGWVLMEAPAPIVFAVCFLIGSWTNAVTLVFLVLWEAHYLHRAFIYPLGLRGSAKRIPLVVMSFGFLFNIMNGYLNGRYIFNFSGGYNSHWLSDPRFILGTTLFIVGFIINRQADSVLRDLRRPGESGYKISYNRIYRWVSSPNYLGEIIIWTGWAVATWSLTGLAFAFWTAANLIPRAKANHAWYRRTFPDYPPERKALVPGIW
jgi:protein-S-isoprenylcysteine O-methyltransferase Ste14